MEMGRVAGRKGGTSGTIWNVSQVWDFRFERSVIVFKNRHSEWQFLVLLSILIPNNERMENNLLKVEIYSGPQWLTVVTLNGNGRSKTDRAEIEFLILWSSVLTSEDMKLTTITKSVMPACHWLSSQFIFQALGQGHAGCSRRCCLLPVHIHVNLHTHS